MKIALLAVLLAFTGCAVEEVGTTQQYVTPCPGEDAGATIAVSSVYTFATGANATSYTTAEYNPPTGGILVADVHVKAFAGPAEIPLSFEGNGVTWQLVGEHSMDTVQKILRYKAVGTPSFGAITAEFVNTRTAFGVHVYNVTGASDLGETVAHSENSTTSISVSLGHDPIGALVIVSTNVKNLVISEDADYTEIHETQSTYSWSSSWASDRGSHTAQLSQSARAAILLTELI